LHIYQKQQCDDDYIIASRIKHANPERRVNNYYLYISR